MNFSRARRTVSPAVMVFALGVGLSVSGSLLHAQVLRVQPVVAGIRSASADSANQDTTRRDTASGRPMSLVEAVTFAGRRNEDVRIAQNAVRRAEGQQDEARSSFLPQLNGSANYTRTLRSQYQGIFTGSPTDTSQQAAPPGPCNQYLLNASSPLTDRVTGLETYAQCSEASQGSLFGGFNFSDLGFGQPNQYTVGLSFTQNLFTGGRSTGQMQTANAGRRAADIGLTAQKAQLILNVTQAYYNAALADRMLAIAQLGLDQSDRLLQQTQAEQKVGNVSEYDLLRATVSRDNQRPIVLQRQNDRDVAYLQLKQILNLPLDEPLRLTTSIEDSTAVPPGVDLSKAARPDTSSDHRASVRQADENVVAQQGQVKVARAARLPSLQLSSLYDAVAYPTGGLPSTKDFLPNWTVALGLSVPIFNGGRVHGDELVAEANLRDAQEQLQQSRKAAALDSRTALNNLRQAEATLAANQGTAQQAQRAYDIAEVRYREGLSTQIDLTDAQNLLEQALANRAQAARDVLVARVKLALLPDLPVQAANGAQAAAAQQQQQQAQQATQQQQAAAQQQQQPSTNPTQPQAPSAQY